MGLDVRSPAGDEADRLGQAMGRLLAEDWGVQWVASGNSNLARVDGLLVQDGRLQGVVECKVRNDSRSLIERWGGSYLITADKLEAGAEAARLLHAPFTLCVYLKPDERAFWWRVAEIDGSWTRPFDRAVTRTQATVNGGMALRENAFLPMATVKGSKRIPYPLLRELAGLSASAVQVNREQGRPDGARPGRALPCKA